MRNADQPTLTIQLLGPLQVRVGEHEATFRTDAERALLAILAAHQGAAQRRDTLAALLSPDRPDVEALTYLRNRLARLRDALLARSAWTEALAVAQRQLQLEPWLEAAHRAIMTAHARLGDRNAALAQFEQCERQLSDELGVEPEDATRELRRQIFDNSLDTPSTPEAATNVPLHNGRFFGRKAEQALLLQRLVDPAYRLLTIVGAGGMGKTRLAVEVGRQAMASFPHGVWFVALDAVNGGAEQVKIAVGEALGLEQQGKQLTGEQVLAILRERRALLIFDNCKLLLDALAFVPDWLRRAPQLVILATSREPLGFQAEALIALGGLPTGATALSAAEALFAERAQMARDDFVLSGEQLPLVRQICAQVDGAPLGIALAAAWVRRRSLAQIHDEIGRSLDFLSTRMRDVDLRHRSMRAVFETSWQLLDSDAQTVLAALSVFPATFTAQAAAAVARATPADLDTLCEKSLLQQWHEPERYTLHSLLRWFAAEKLAARTAGLESAFVDYFFAFARSHQHDYDGLQPEWRNLFAAVVKAHRLQAWRRVLELVADAGWRPSRLRRGSSRRRRCAGKRASRSGSLQP